jgi:phytanoyl-CoA hydroxylase
VTDYEHDGYMIVRDLLAPEQVAAALAETSAICRGERGNIDGLVPASPEADGPAVLAPYLCIHFPHKISPLVLDIALNPRAIGILTELIGPNVKMMQSMLFMKAAGKPGQAWHQDESHIPTRDRSLTAIWIALDDATTRNGCLWVLPGSHRAGVLHPVRDHDNPSFDGTPAAYGFDDRNAVPVELPAGSAVVFNGYLLHRSLPNRSHGSMRRALVNHYMSAESLLPWFPPDPGEPMATLDHRDIVLVAGVDPHAAKGTLDIHRPWLRTERPSRATR